MDFNLTTEQQQIRKGSLPRISRCLLARSGRAAASRATIATERVLHAHRLALRGIAVGSLAAACVFRLCPHRLCIAGGERPTGHHRSRQAVTSGQASVRRRRP